MNVPSGFQEISVNEINPLTHLIATLNNSWKPLHIDLNVLIDLGNVSIYVQGVCDPITGIDIASQQ